MKKKSGEVRSGREVRADVNEELVIVKMKKKCRRGEKRVKGGCEHEELNYCDNA